MKQLFLLILTLGALGCDGAPAHAPCDDDTQCPTGQYCATGGCTFDCRIDIDCVDRGPGAVCDTARGRCGTGGTDGGVACTPACSTSQRCSEDGTCVESTCGDSFVDPAQSEECDDGNTTAFDGCENDCQFTCEADADCDDGNSCTGEESCGSDHNCVAGTPLADGTPCTSSTVTGGVCASGSMCIPAGCGNHTIDGSEECDDGRNGDQTDGCKDDCTFSCHGSIECSNANACDGEESCDPTSHRCFVGSPLSCMPSDACHTASCVAATGCVQALVDGDGDAHAARSLGACGDDCNDASASVHPGAGEVTGDGIDEDCNGQEICFRDNDGDRARSPSTTTITSADADCNDTGEALDGPTDCNDSDAAINPSATETAGNSVDENCDGRILCYVDMDYDGYGSSTTVVSLNLSCYDSLPSGGRETVMGGDCCDSDSSSYPSSGNYTANRNSCGSFDTDCDGVEEPEYGTGACAVSGGGCAMIYGFQSPTACGSMGFYISYCQSGCCPTTCTPNVNARTQRCH